MVEHCDKCGTELAASQARHQRYRIEHPGGSESDLEGRLCSDCVWEFEAWLETKSE